MTLQCNTWNSVAPDSKGTLTSNIKVSIKPEVKDVTIGNDKLKLVSVKTKGTKEEQK